MKGLNYKSIQTYSYEKSKEEMKRILEYDGLKNWQQNDDCKIVEYTIDHSMQITLSLLLYFQEIKLVRLTIAQNIQLCLDILKKHQELEKQNIQHNYLSSDRILINLIDKQHQITILPERLFYTIHFVGYDCPFYERENYKDSKKKDDQSIKEIIINIIQASKKQKLIDKQKGQEKQIFTDQKKTDEKQKELDKKQKEFEQKNQNLIIIFNALLTEGIFKSFDRFIEESKSTFEKFNNQNNKYQRLTGVEKGLTMMSKRSRRIENVTENLEQIQKQYYKKGKTYEYQQILQLTFPLIAKKLTTATLYYNQEPPKNDDTFINLNNLKEDLIMNNEEMIIQLINENKEEIMKDFKFELDLQSIVDDVSSQLKDNQFKIPKIPNYYFNDVNFSKKSKCNPILRYVVKGVTIQTLNNYVELQILILISELI